MAIGCCDCCDRENVPVSHLTETYCGDVTACFLCQGDTDPDPYGELVEVPCSACGSEGCLIHWTGGMDRYGNPIEREEECPHCRGTGGEWIGTQPVTLDDLEELDELESRARAKANAAAITDIAIPVLAELVSVSLFIGMIAIWAAIGSGA